MGRTELNKYVFSLVGLSLVVLAGLVTVIVSMQSYLSHPHAALHVQPFITPTSAPQRDNTTTAAFPKVTVADWGEIPPPIFSPPVRTTLYALKQQYTRLEFANLAQHFIPVVDDRVVESDKGLSMTTAGDHTDVFYLYKRTGSFFYKSETGVALPKSGSTEREQVNAFMRSLWNDATLQVTGSYEKQSTPETVYYELHRDWDKVGLPIVNLIGTFNIAEHETISALSLLTIDNHTDTLARADDFNTATVGVSGGKIVSVVSNIRPVNPQGTRPHALISYEEAIAKLRNGDYLYIYTSPAGEGSANANMMYKDNSVALEDVHVNESLAAYVEDLPDTPQTQLYPYFIFRGGATSQSGYRVNFVAAVSAVSDVVLGASTARDIRLLSQNKSNPTQQQGTFLFVEPPAKQVSIESPVSEYTSAASASAQKQVAALVCNSPPSPGDLESVVTSAGGQVYGRFRSREWYVVPGGGWNVKALQSAVNTVWDDLKTIPSAERQQRIAAIIAEFSAVRTGCPMRITGVSPTLFVYGLTGSSVSVHSGAKITYSDPPAEANTWNDLLGSNPYLYYEYQPVKFKRPENGWNVARRDLSSLVDRVAQSISLNLEESARLKVEIGNASGQIVGDSLFVGVIPQSEIDRLVPLSVQHMPVLRYHFYVTRAGSNHISAPVLSPLVRQSRMALEIGAVAQ